MMTIEELEKAHRITQLRLDAVESNLNGLLEMLVELGFVEPEFEEISEDRTLDS